MAHIVVVAHAPLATALQALAAHAYPECAGRLIAVDVGPDEGLDAVEARVRAALSPVLAGGEEALVLVDVFGATPCNGALAAVDGVRARVVAGVNVPMLWRSLCYATLPLEELVPRAVAGASQGVMHVPVSRRQNQGPAPKAHDPVQHHHQQ